MTSKKIAFISTMLTAPWGGSEALWSETALLALKEGHQVLISIYHWGELPPKVQVLKKAGAQIHLRERYNPHASLWERGLKRMGSIFTKNFHTVQAFEPDLVCISQGETFDICYNEPLQSLLGELNCPFILICHSSLNGESLQDSIRLKAKELFGKANFVGFVAKRTSELAEKCIASPISKTVILKNPVNLSHSEALPFPALDIPHFACVGALITKTKGYDILLEALSNDTWKNRQWKLNMYGAGQDLNYLTELIQFYNLGEKVALLGHIDDLGQIWRHNHLLIISSRIESAPLVLVEAMLCARLVIATDVGGISEWMKDGRNGYLAEAATVRHLRAALERAWQHQHQWEAMGIQANLDVSKEIDRHPDQTLLNLLLNEVG